MTTTGPEPGWCLDPDGGDNERYWNGIEWTQHRRSRRPTVSQPPESFSHPADIEDSISSSTLDGRHQAGSALEEGVRSQDADTLTPSSSWSGNPPSTWATSTVDPPIDWSAEADTPAEKPMPRRRSSVAYYLFVVLAVISAGVTLIWGITGLVFTIKYGQLQNVLLATLWGGAWTALWVRLARRRRAARSQNLDPTSESPAAQTPETAPPSESTEPRLRGWAEVVGGDKWGFIGWAGKIVTIDSDNVGLKFEGYSGTYYFQRNHLKAITRPISHQQSASPATPDSEAVAAAQHSGDDRPRTALRTAATPGSESTELRLGGMAKVVGGNRWFTGRVGKIVTIDSDRVGLKCKGRWGKRYFWRNHVVPAATEDQPDGRPTPKSSPADPAARPAPTMDPPRKWLAWNPSRGDNPQQQRSSGFTTVHKVICTVGVCVAAILGIAFIASATGHSQEYKDCVSRFQYVADGSPGNTQQDLEELCEVMTE